MKKFGQHHPSLREQNQKIEGPQSGGGVTPSDQNSYARDTSKSLIDLVSNRIAQLSQMPLENQGQSSSDLLRQRGSEPSRSNDMLAFSKAEIAKRAALASRMHS
jgi:hypothetical protein